MAAEKIEARVNTLTPMPAFAAAATNCLRAFRMWNVSKLKSSLNIVSLFAGTNRLWSPNL